VDEKLMGYMNKSVQDEHLSIEMETYQLLRSQDIKLVGSLRMDVGTVYRPYIDCQEVEVKPPNLIEEIFGITMSKKVEKAAKKLERKLLKRYEKGKSLKDKILSEIKQRREEFFRVAI
jgi:ABC-type arginine transport system ATPase subunit